MSEVASQTLHLVARELASELNEARAALETFGEQQGNLDLLRKCGERLHIVHGALRIAEVYGAALLAEEMEQVTRYLIENFEEKRHLAEGLDALMRAMVQLPTYLERVMSGGRDMALVLLPLLNDLRAVRGHALLSEGTLLLLNLTSDQQASPSPAAPGEAALTVAQWARKIRTRFQLGLLGWIKGERLEQNLEMLSRAAEKLEQVATTQPVFQLFWVVGAVLEGLREGGLEGTASIKRLLGQADREMKRLYEQGEARYSEAPAVDLLNNLLYYVARTRSTGPRVAAVRASFRLNDLIPVDEQVEEARESLAAPSVKLMKTVAAAIKEDLARVKDALDIFVRKGATQPEELNSQLELLRKIGDTLGVLGLGELREKVQIEANELQAIVTQRTPPSEGTLLRMAATLIRIEDSLDEQLVGLIVPVRDEPRAEGAPKVDKEDDLEFRQVTEAVLRECIVNMARIKEAVSLSVEKPSEAQNLDQVPQLIRGITAGLLMLGKTRAVEITEGIAQSLSRYVRTDGSGVVREAVDRLADAIVAVEYYMETIQAGRSDPWYMLDNAETCLRYLSEVDASPTISPLQIPGMDPARTLVIDAMAAQQAAATQDERTAVLTHALEPHEQPDWKPAAVVPVATTTVPSDAPVVLRPDVDPEFIELFIEEAKDEIEKLQRLFPLWDDNPQDQEALTHVRRSFHTLKGSGRMVGAQLIGDFAWSIENLLNRVINKTLERSPDMMVVLRQGVGAVPQLVEQLETGRTPSVDVMKLIAQANDIAGVRPAATAPARPHTPPPAAPTIQVESTPPTLTEHVPPLSPTMRQLRALEPSAPARTGNTSLNLRLDAFTPSTADRSALESQTQVASEEQSSGSTLDDVLGTESPTGTAERHAAAEQMDPVLHEIFAKETAGHLTVIREYISNCDLVPAPHPVTEALHRACHTLSGTAKTAGARQGIKIAGPLNRYIRKLYDNSLPLPATGLAALKDAVGAIDDIVEHIDEDTGYFAKRLTLTARLAELEQELDASIAEQTQIELRHADATITTPALIDEMSASATELSASFEQAQGATDPFATLENDPDVIELPATDARELDTFTLRALREQMAAQLGTSSLDEEQETRRQPALSEDLVLSDEQALSTLTEPSLDDLPEVIELSGDMQDDDSPTDAPRQQAEPVWSASFSNEEIVLSDSTAQVPELSEADIHFDAQAFAEPEHIEVVSEPELDALPELTDPVALSTDESATHANTDTSAGAPSPTLEPSGESRDLQEMVSAAPAQASTPVEDGADESEEFDPDVAAIFTEEATELLEVADSSLAAWTRDRANQALVFELKRVLHTLKGGARMAGLRAMGDLSHELESFMQGVESGTTPAEQPVFEALQASLDELHRMRDLVANGERCKPARTLIARIRAIGRGETPAVEVEAPAPEPQPAPIVQEVQIASFAAPANEAVIESVAVEPLVSETVAEEIEAVEVEFVAEELAAPAVFQQPAIEATDEEPAPEQTPVVLPPGREPQQQERQEFARVDADLLDTLLNSAGEVSIFRSRLEQQVSSIEYNLAELSRTVTRLKDQLRKMELETEAQILHKHQEDTGGRTDFDPLELDRYSSIQQLSRALAESVADVGSIQGLLENLTREGQNLLLQQSRVVTELQNGLMRTRMVPFQRHVQRLSRLVRQVATDTGKRAELVVEGASGELDRQVLERMLPPFEHMLRNSVVHGIETPEERAAKGKPENGTITVGLHREGSEMVIVLEDDGRGIDVNAVRERALQRGLLQPGTVLTDEEALQLVLEPGFSTASTVTQHAGRGVGMDVVVNEIKRLGGVLFTESKPNHGVKFTIRLPFTLAITQALIVRVGEEQYALPLPSVEGVARVSREQVQQHLSEETPTFNYGGQIYRFQHLGSFVGAGPSMLPDNDAPVPIVLVRAGEHSTALVTDELVGSREMVVKSVGPQVATIRGIAGATILGDGRIVIILDMGALVRSEWRSRGPMEAQPMQERRTLVLVVDDSITVRRVTQRLLERNGMRVLTAKDGVDAWTLLQEHVPDVILLDIEMPRMDGYELAAQVRAEPRLADVPIVMITSRVGEKHRARAIELGVNDYLGKPYQENQLLDAIEPLVHRKRQKAS